MDRRSFLTAISSAFAGSVITPQLNGGLLSEPIVHEFMVRFGVSNVANRQIRRFANPFKLTSAELKIDRRNPPTPPDGSYPHELRFGSDLFLSFRGKVEGGGTLEFYGKMARFYSNASMFTELIFGNDRMSVGLTDYRIYYPYHGHTRHWESITS